MEADETIVGDGITMIECVIQGMFKARSIDNYNLLMIVVIII